MTHTEALKAVAVALRRADCTHVAYAAALEGKAILYGKAATVADLTQSYSAVLHATPHHSLVLASDDRLLRCIVAYDNGFIDAPVRMLRMVYYRTKHMPVSSLHLLCGTRIREVLLRDEVISALYADRIGPVLNVAGSHKARAYYRCRMDHIGE